MRCEESQPLIQCYLDHELDAPRSAELEAHVSKCATCEPEMVRALELHTALRESAPYFSAPHGLKLRIRETIRAEAGVQDVKPVPGALGSWWRGTATAASLAAVFLLAIVVAPRFFSKSADERLTDEVFTSHVRSLMASHLTDVTSSDRHTVKPWFNGKVDFAPAVPDFYSDGFPLIGGRLDYINHRAVAALVYQRRLHYINVFIWPVSSPATAGTKMETREGYNILHWQQSGMQYWAISDLAANEMQRLSELMQQ